MLHLKLLRIIIIAVMAMTIFMPVAQARLIAGGPETVITNSTLILTGKVIKSNEAEEERTFTVLVDRVLKGDYIEPEIKFTAKKNPVYGWMGNIRTLPEINTELLLFLRYDDNENPYFTFNLNCIAIIEGQQVTSLLDGSNIGINDEHWEIEDYIHTYNKFLNKVTSVSVRTDPVSLTVLLDGLPVIFDAKPVIQQNRTLVPFRAIAEALNVNVSWDNTSKTVKATGGGTLIQMQIGNEIAFCNGEPITLDVPPVILNGRTLIPLRFFSEAFDCIVSWDPSTYSVEITSGPKEMTVIGFYALGDSRTSSWTNLFGQAYPETAIGNTDMVDELALGWYSLDEQGHLLTSSWTGWQRPAGWEDVLKAAAEFNLRTEMVIHATDRYGEISALLANKTATAAFIDAIMAEAALYGGVNLNLEEYGLSKSGEDLTSVQQLLTDFVRLLSGQLRAANKSLTLTVHPPNSAYKGYDYKSLGELADRIVVMAYDYGPKPEPVSLVKQAIETASAVVPPEKLLLGISAYYETVESIVPKLGMAKRYNLQGIALWRLGLVPQEMWQVLRSNVL